MTFVLFALIHHGRLSPKRFAWIAWPTTYTCELLMCVHGGQCVHWGNVRVYTGAMYVCTREAMYVCTREAMYVCTRGAMCVHWGNVCTWGNLCTVWLLRSPVAGRIPIAPWGNLLRPAPPPPLCPQPPTSQYVHHPLS